MTVNVRHSWKDVRDFVRKRILDSTYRPGDKLPRDKDLAIELDCARSTVQRAMRSLADDGIVQRKRKGGTFINPDPVTRTTLDIPITKVEIESRGSEYRHHLITDEILEAPASVAARFGVAGASPVRRVKALHTSDGQPYIFEDRWISLETVPEFRDVDLSQISANEWLVRNRPFSKCIVQIYAKLIGNAEAKFMEAPTGAALLVVERTTWIDANPITYVQSTYAPGYRLVTGN